MTLATNTTLDPITTGEHTLDAWMREDGLRVDRKLLITDTNYIPSGLGPAESPSQTITETIPGGLGTTNIAYQYDALYRLTGAAYSGAITATYAYIYHSVGNMTAFTETVDSDTTVVTRTFDAANRLQTALDLEVGTSSYYYDNIGNLVETLLPGATGQNPTGSLRYGYDQRNLLVTHTTYISGTGWVLQAEYVYDGSSDRLQQVDYTGALPITTTYTNDVFGLTQVLVANDSTTQVYNLFGLGLISQDSDSGVRTLLVDGLGSVRMEMVSGVVETTTTYTPYGEVLEQTGTSETVYSFTGEQRDSATGLLYLRARYYSLYINRYHSRDPFSGYSELPRSQNDYTYAYNNPVNLTDPTGRDPWWCDYQSYPGVPSHAIQDQIDNCRIDYYEALVDIQRLGLVQGQPLIQDPLTEAQWLLAKQEAMRFGLPKELVAATLAAEIVYDTDFINTIYDVSTGIVGAGADLGYTTRDRPLFDLCYALLEGFHEYFGLASYLEPKGYGYGAAPGIANIHAGPAVRTEDYFDRVYPNQGYLPNLGETNQKGMRLRTLLTDAGGIRYAAAYLRWWADIRTGTESEHLTGLTDNDMIIIYTAYRCDVIACYGSVAGFQTAQTPSPYGSPDDFAAFLPLYKIKP